VSRLGRMMFISSVVMAAFKVEQHSLLQLFPLSVISTLFSSHLKSN